MTPAPDLVDSIMEVMDQAFDPAYGEAWNRRQVSDALCMPSTHAIVIDDGGRAMNGQPMKPAGFVMTRHAAGEEELLLIAVNPDARGRGLGRKLIDHLFADARARGASRIFLEMRRGNPAQHLYSAMGFEPIGERRGYYRMSNGDRIDAITFGCSI